MSEEILNSDNQIAETVETTPVESTPTEAQPTEYDVIKYNKEEVQIPVEERQKYLQQGYFYETKVKTELETLKQQNAYLDKMAQLSGYTNRDEFIAAVEESERQRQIEAEAEKLGVTPEHYKEFLQPVNSELQTVKTELEQLRQQEATRQIESQVMTLASKYSDFEQHKDQVFSLAIEKGYDLEDAYKLATYESKLQAIRTQTEQEALQKLQSNQSSSPGALSEGTEHVTSYSQLSKEAKAELRERVKRGEQINL